MKAFKQGKIPYTPTERNNRRYFRKLQRALNMACGKTCTRCGSSTTSTQNKAHGRALRNAGIEKVKCRSCRRYW